MQTLAVHHDGKSSISGFVKVVRIGDGGTPYLLIVVGNTPISKDPIDSLQIMFNDWKESLFTTVDPFLSQIIVDPDSIPADGISQALVSIIPKNNSDTLLVSGKQIVLSNTGAGTLSSVIDLGDGTYQATITAPIAMGTDSISALVISGTDTVSIFRNTVVAYINPISVNENLISPNRFYLYQNYPQPFNPSTTIKYQIPELSYVTLKVYDVLGNEIEKLVDEEKPSGTYELTWHADNLPSGVYFYQLKGWFIC